MGLNIESCGHGDCEVCIDIALQKHDEVNHPKHYNEHPSGVECIEITEHFGFCVGNAIKYLWRAGLKHNPKYDAKECHIQDLSKAAWYINREIDRVKNVKPIP